MSATVTINPNLLREVAEKLRPGLDSFDQTVATSAKQNLYPGHGYRTGALQKTVEPIPARIDGTNVIGGVEATTAYALVIHNLYEYITQALEAHQAEAPSIITGG